MSGQRRVRWRPLGRCPEGHPVIAAVGLPSGDPCAVWVTGTGAQCAPLAIRGVGIAAPSTLRAPGPAAAYAGGCG